MELIETDLKEIRKNQENQNKSGKIRTGRKRGDRGNQEKSGKIRKNQNGPKKWKSEKIRKNQEKSG